MMINENTQEQRMESEATKDKKANIYFLNVRDGKYKSEEEKLKYKSSQRR